MRVCGLGFENVAGASFCGECIAPLASTINNHGESRAALASQRRSTRFCTVSRSSPLWGAVSRLGPSFGLQRWSH